MLPTPPPQNRILRTTEVEQYSLPYAAETECFAAGGEAGQSIDQRTRRSRQKIAPTESVTVPQRNSDWQMHRKKKPPAKVTLPPDAKLLVRREDAAAMLSISVRGVDYLIAARRLSTRRIGTRVLIPIEAVRKFARGDHPEPLALPADRFPASSGRRRESRRAVESSDEPADVRLLHQLHPERMAG